MAGEPGSEEFRKIKEEINSEGWEGDGDTGSAVFVGTQEEAEQARARMEREGQVVDLQTYIKLHAKIDVTADELDRTLEKFKYDIGYYSENINPENARCDNINVSEGTANIYYYDKGKNIKKLTVDINKISEFSDVTVKSAEDFFDILEEKFEKLGFKFDRKAMHNIGWLIDRYIPDARTAWAQEEKGSEEFEF